MGTGNHINRGDLLPEIALPSLDGRLVRLADYRGRFNLVLVLAGQGEEKDVLRLLDEMAAGSSEFAVEEAEVLAIVSNDAAPGVKTSRWPFVVLADGESRAHWLFNAVNTLGRSSPAVFIADRYGEVYAGYRSGEDGPPSTEEILHWLFFINSQCPECGVPDWPR